MRSFWNATCRSMRSAVRRAGAKVAGERGWEGVKKVKVNRREGAKRDRGGEQQRGNSAAAAR